jgi:hypothetical protein
MDGSNTGLNPQAMTQNIQKLPQKHAKFKLARALRLVFNFPDLPSS